MLDVLVVMVVAWQRQPNLPVSHVILDVLEDPALVYCVPMELL